MIRFACGNLLESTAEALVNAVNEVGVMGKGIALLFRDTFPESAREYTAACKAKKVRVGSMLATRDGGRWIIHFPTKQHWRNPSKFEWIRDGLKDLVRVVRENRVQSIAIPALGCGNGGLEWSQVRPEIEAALAGLDDVEISVYEPADVSRSPSK